MYLDVEDYRPETPRVPPALSRREGVLLSLIFHGLLVAAIVLLPKLGWVRDSPHRPLLMPDETVRFVAVEPRIDRPAPPKRPAVESDLDRRSATVERAPKPENTDPFSRGNTPERLEGAPAQKLVGPESPTPAPPAAQPAPPSVATKVAPVLDAPAKPAGGSLGESLRNLQRYLQEQNFDNQKGGQAEDSADISFDSKGVDFGPWLRRFRAQVMSNWFVPQSAQLFKGHVVLTLNIHRNGSITDLKVVQKSPYEAFDIAAYNALRTSNPTMALPAEYPGDVVFFTVTFFYNERIRL